MCNLKFEFDNFGQKEMKKTCLCHCFLHMYIESKKLLYKNLYLNLLKNSYVNPLKIRIAVEKRVDKCIPQNIC